MNIMAGQTLLDLAMQKLGSVEAVFALSLLNGMSVTDDLQAGDKLNCDLTPYSPQVLNIYNDNQYKPASGLNIPGQQIPVSLTGIDYWVIENDFIVQ